MVKQGTDEIHDLDDTIEAGTVTAPQDDLRSENDDGTVTLTLKYPVSAKFRQNNQERDENFTAVTIRRANGGDLREVIKHQKDEERVVVLLFTRLTGLPSTVFDKLDAEDCMRFYEEVQRFLPQSRQTGTN
jgi:hypothetical protein